MAEAHGGAGGMDIRQNQEMWRNFTRLMLWSVIGIAVVLILMAIFLV
jgi:hypothetical protein